MTEKPVAVVLPSWNPNEPRFIIEDATEYTSDDRVFKNGKCVFNQRLGFAYSVEEIVEVLNSDELEKENEQLKQLVNEAEDIIICQCTPYYQRIWENIKKNIKGDVE